MESIHEKISFQDMEKAFELWQQHRSFSSISKHLQVPQADIIRAVREMEIHQAEKCKRCYWRREKQSSCVLPYTFCNFKVPTKRKGQA